MGKKNVYERFVWFDREVRAGRHPNAGALARRFEVSHKTAQRDIEFMRDRLRCPLVYDKKEKGYGYEDETHTLPSIFLSSRELSSLLIARKVLKDLSGGHLGDEIGSIIEKISGFLDSHSVDIKDIDSVISLKHIEYLQADERVFLAALEGCLRRRRLCIGYKGMGDARSSPRVVDPYHIFSYKGTWHLLAFCHKRESLRDFVLARVSSADMLDEVFAMPADFDIAAYFARSFGLYRGRAKNSVVLRFAPRAAGWVSGQIWHEDQTMRTLRDGSIEIAFRVEDFTEIRSEVLKYGSLVEVMKPRELREMVLREAAEMARVYRRGARAGRA